MQHAARSSGGARLVSGVTSRPMESRLRTPRARASPGRSGLQTGLARGQRQAVALCMAAGIRSYKWAQRTPRPAVWRRCLREGGEVKGDCPCATEQARPATGPELPAIDSWLRQSHLAAPTWGRYSPGTGIRTCAGQGVCASPPKQIDIARQRGVKPRHECENDSKRVWQRQPTWPWY